MRINNVSSGTSLKSIVLLSATLLIFLIGFVFFYICTAREYSNFAEWINAVFQMFANIDDFQDKIMLIVIFLVLPIGILWGLIYTLIERHKNLKLLNEGLNLKYVDFLPGRIDFNFTQPQYNFTCGYEDIEKLNINLDTVEVHSKGNTYIVLREIKLTFKVLNNKSFSLYNTPIYPVKLLYKIIDYTRGIENFSYKFSGAGVNRDLQEKIEDYRLKGCKQILSNQQENAFKLMSILFFAMGTFFVVSFFEDLSSSLVKGDYGIIFLLLPFLFFFVIALVMNIFLIIDKINDRRFNALHKSNELLSKIPCEFIITSEVLLFVIMAFMLLRPVVLSINDNKILEINNGFQRLFINPMSEYNFMKKDEIYRLRKDYVKDSLFATEDYEPNSAVFGSIVDYKPWWGEIKCTPQNYTGDYSINIKGNSKQSKQINNPNVLVGLSSPYIMYDRQENDFCSSDYADFMPSTLKYNKDANLIVVEYYVTEDFLNTYVQISDKRKRYPVQLSGLNALDFGYKYVYAYNTKNIEMSYSDNVTENVKTFQDYIHLGSSCHYQDGCNNISPMQNDKMFSLNHLPAELNLKLWKKEPINKFQKADMYYRIIFK